MKRVLMVLLLVLCSSPAWAFRKAPPQLHVSVQRPQPRVQITLGMARIHTKKVNYRIAYLPFLAPLPYSYPRTTQQIPNPFVLTGTEFPHRPSHHR